MGHGGHRLCDNNDDLSSVHSKSLKRRGLSRFYSSRSQSFTSLDLSLCTSHGDSTLALQKRCTSAPLPSASSSSMPQAARSVPSSSPDHHHPAAGGGALFHSCPSTWPRVLMSVCDGDEFDGSAGALSCGSWPQPADDLCTAFRLTTLGRGARHGDAAAARGILAAASCQRPFHSARVNQHVLVGSCILGS